MAIPGSCEDAAGDMAIEDHLYGLDGYFVRTAYPVYPFPVLLEFPSKLLQTHMEAEPQWRCRIVDLLETYQIEAYNMEFFALAKPGYSDGSDE